MTEMLRSLDWNTLQQRRKEARLGELYRIQHDLVDIPKDKFLPLSNQSRKNTSDSRTHIRFYHWQDVHQYLFPQDNCRLEQPGINSHRSRNIGCFLRVPAGLHLNPPHYNSVNTFFIRFYNFYPVAKECSISSCTYFRRASVRSFWISALTQEEVCTSR